MTDGSTLEEVKQLMREAIALQIEGLREEGLPVPPSTSSWDDVELQKGAA